MPVDYKNGKIYTIRNRNDDTLIYVGSTCNTLTKRFNAHKNDSRTEGKNQLLFYKTVDGYWDDWYIELYEEYPCENKEQLNRREGQVIREIGTLNLLIAGRTEKEWRNDNIERIRKISKKYREDNKEDIKVKQQEKYKKNKEHILQKCTEYRYKNIETVREKDRARNKEKRSNKFQCICGSVIPDIQHNKNLHEKTKKHLKYIEENQ